MQQPIYPRPGDRQTVYLKAVVKNPNIVAGDHTIYNDFVHDPADFERNNVLYHYPVNGDRLLIGKFCSIACGAKFLFNSANHTLRSLANYPFPLLYDAWGLDKGHVADAWDNKGDIVIGNDGGRNRNGPVVGHERIHLPLSEGKLPVRIARYRAGFGRKREPQRPAAARTERPSAKGNGTE